MKENGKYKKRIYLGTDEEGNRLFKVLEGDSEEEVREKEDRFQAKKAVVRQNDWLKHNRERISVVVPIGTKARISKTGSTINNFIAKAIEKSLKDKGV